MPDSTPTSSPTSSSSRATSTDPGTIAGGILGGLALLAVLASGALLFIRHRRKSHPPPSAEFMHLARGPSELAFATVDGKKSPTLHRLITGPLGARRGSLSLEDEENIPPLSPTQFCRDPVLEKAQESAAMREKYVASEEGGYQ